MVPSLLRPPLTLERFRAGLYRYDQVTRTRCGPMLDGISRHEKRVLRVVPDSVMVVAELKADNSIRLKDGAVDSIHAWLLVRRQADAVPDELPWEIFQVPADVIVSSLKDLAARYAGLQPCPKFKLRLVEPCPDILMALSGAAYEV